MHALPLSVRALHLAFEAIDPIVPPQAVGAMWRGVFGRALRARNPALYARVFEAKAPAGVAERYDDAPAPFALEAAPPHELVASPGETLDLWLKLFGDLDAAPIVDAFADAAGQGLGKGRGRAELSGVASMWRDDADGASDPLALSPHVPEPPPTPGAVRVALTSPLRLRAGGGIIEAHGFEPESWLRALERRLHLLTALHGAAPFPKVGDRAKASLRDPQLWPVPMHRWSARQKREIDMSGVMGNFLLPLEGLANVWPMLWLGQWTQVGSGTSAGLGGYRLKQP